MLDETIRQLVERQAHVLEADLLAHDQERHDRKAAVHGPHDVAQHRGVAHAGVEQP
ncbi:hypothetical protein D3C83_331730 [compost metagenome]